MTSVLYASLLRSGYEDEIKLSAITAPFGGVAKVAGGKCRAFILYARRARMHARHNGMQFIVQKIQSKLFRTGSFVFLEVYG